MKLALDNNLFLGKSCKTHTLFLKKMKYIFSSVNLYFISLLYIYDFLSNCFPYFTFIRTIINAWTKALMFFLFVVVKFMYGLNIKFIKSNFIRLYT